MIVYDGATRVWYHSYYLGDAYLDSELRSAVSDSDGLLGVAPNTAAITTGTSAGVINLQIHLVDELPPLPPDAVASRCSLELTDGRVEIWAAETEPDWTHTFGHPVVLGVQVIAHDRDLANQDPGLIRVPVERHEIFLCETTGTDRVQGSGTDIMLRMDSRFQRRQRTRR